MAKPRPNRPHIVVVGRRNVGKSSLVNALTRQQTSIVSPIAGTTTDVVEKVMELQPLGPVVFLDTGGLDDVGDLGRQRIEKTQIALRRADLLLLVTDGTWQEADQQVWQQAQEQGRPLVWADNHRDRQQGEQLRGPERLTAIPVSAHTSSGLDALRAALIASLPENALSPPSLLGDLIQGGDLVVFVVPIDKEAPKDRLIAPQIQALRDALDHDAMVLVVKERELPMVFGPLNLKPKLVVTDSQAFLKVAADTPPNVAMTSFSVLFARLKGDLSLFAQGAAAIDRLKPRDRILIAESCAHHPIGEDIGTVKIPRWLNQLTGGGLEFDFCRGHDFPESLETYRLIIQCGGCRFNRAAVLGRVSLAQAKAVPITNYGLAIAHSLGICPRALKPFPAALQAYQDALTL